MKHVLKVSRHLKGPTQPIPIAPIWTSDALVIETFDRFLRGCKRHGSHVPGPLEARKRATKRKNTHVAYNGTPAAPIDVGGLFGPGQQGRWWKEPQRIEDRTPQRKSDEAADILPSPSGHQSAVPLREMMSWFGKAPAPPIPQAKMQGLELKITRSYPLSTAQLKDREVAFQEDLFRAQGLDELRSLVRQQKLDSSQALVFTTLALQHILQLKWSLADIKEFLLDSVLNPPGAKPFRVLGNALKGEWVDQNTRAGLFDIICQCVTLGLASPEEVRHTIRSIPRHKIPAGTPLGRLGEDSAIHEHYQKILSAVSESKVVSIEDLGNEFLYTWFKDISNRPFAPLGACLLWEMRRYSGLSEKDLASSLLFRLLPYSLQADTIATSEEGFAKFLGVLPTDVLPHVLVRATQSLIAASDNAIAGREDLPIVRLQETLAGLSKEMVEHIFASTETWIGCLTEHGAADQRAVRAVIVCWLAVSISKGTRQAERQLRKLRLRNSFKTIYSEPNGHGTRDILAQFLGTVQSLPLTNTNLLLARLRFVTDDYLVAYNRNFMLRVTEKDVLRSFSLLQNDRDYDHFRVYSNDALVSLAESVNNDLDLFKQVFRHYVKTDESAFRIVLRILKHNLALHNTLSQSWPGRVAQDQATSEAPSQLTAKQEYYAADVSQRSPSVGYTVAPLKIVSSRRAQSHQEHPPISPRQVLDLITHLAISFATSPVITPTQALRKVYWCFEMLHRYGAPIEPAITRALWHAGVTRRGKNGTATTVLKWIVQQVRTVEGDNVANMLIRSAGFRQRIEEQFADLELLEIQMPRDDTGQEDILLGELQKHECLDDRPTMYEPEEWEALSSARQGKAPHWRHFKSGYRGTWRPIPPGKIGGSWEDWPLQDQ